MNAPKLCPHCGGDTFMAYIKRGGMVKSIGTDENGNAKFEILREGAKDNFELELVKCAQCKNNITEADLVDSAKCKTCGKTVNPSEVDDNGNCAVCQLLKANPEVENASKEDLLRMLAQAYRMNNPVANRVQAKVEKGKAVEETVINSSVPSTTATDATDDNTVDTSTAADDILNGKVPDDAKPKRRKATRKGKSTTEVSDQSDGTEDDAGDSAEEPAAQPDVASAPTEPSAEVLSDSEVAQAETVLTNAQQAPFPEINEAMMTPAADPQPQAPTVGGFKMFDGEGEEPF